MLINTIIVLIIVISSFPVFAQTNSKLISNSAKPKQSSKKSKTTTTKKKPKQNPGIVQGNNINQFIDSGDMFTSGSINQYNNLDRGAKKSKTTDKKASKLKKDFKNLTHDLSKTF